VLHNSHQRALIIDRCWLIYDLITEKFQPPHEFPIEFPGLVEIALISGYLQVFVDAFRPRKIERVCNTEDNMK